MVGFGLSWLRTAGQYESRDGNVARNGNRSASLDKHILLLWYQHARSSKVRRPCCTIAYRADKQPHAFAFLIASSSASAPPSPSAPSSPSPSADS